MTETVRSFMKFDETHHFQHRLASRGITTSQIEAVLKYGHRGIDCYYLLNDDIKSLLKESREVYEADEWQAFQRIAKRRGLRVVVAEGHVLVTAYGLSESYMPVRRMNWRRPS